MMKKYYYLNSAQQQMGPIYAEDFVRLELDGNTYVWCEGMPNWTKANQVPELLSYLSNTTNTSFGGVGAPKINSTNTENSYRNGAPSYSNMSSNPPQAPCPDNYLVWSILTTIFCCLPFGVVAIVKSSKVENLWKQGFYQEAIKMSQEAKRWSVISAISYAVFLVLYFVFALIAVAMGAMGTAVLL